ncbi:hypothetical protein E1301_Tti001322 [Triplophysa tibetana]|uniref:Uncharacterized protein n=1 Tax=Triplophysa tibetana TaxID=1572043 RepID=A0A5A9P6I6_9TELE|nr:hypothetical protein E1301_Tti001322 [Triplophysa tibetana]
MHELKEKKVTDNTLLSNLDFAECFLREHPLCRWSMLLVKGNGLCVQIGNSKSHVFMVSSDSQQNTYINLHMYINSQICSEHILESHFFGHSCQDEIQCSSSRAREAVHESDLDRLTIKCNRFTIIFTNYRLYNHKTVETKCQLPLKTITVEGLLEKKIWLQKEKATCHGLIACIDHLIKLYLTTSDAPDSGRFILHADKEIIRIVSLGNLINRCIVM